MPENPLGTKEKREELRRERQRWFGDYPPLNALFNEHKEVLRQQNRAFPTALDGLDIAEEMAEHGGHKAHCMGRMQPSLGLKCTCGWSEASAKWQAWKQGVGGTKEKP